MHYTTLIKALCITLLFSHATHVHAMKRKQAQERNKAALQKGNNNNNNTSSVAHAGPIRPEFIEKKASKEEIVEEVSMPEVQNSTPVNESAPISEAVAKLTEVAEEKQAEELVAKSKTKSLLGKELKELYSMDETPLVQKSMFGWTTVDATQPYKDEATLLKGLEKNESTYLKDVQAKQDLNRTLNQLCAGVIQKIKEQSTLDKETGVRSFTIEQIEAIINSQFPRSIILTKILTLCDARIKAKQEPLLHPTEDAKELAQKCFTVLSQLQLERKRIRAEEENNRIRQIKAAQRLAYSMRLVSDKGDISDDEYTDEFIFEKTTEEY